MSRKLLNSELSRLSVEEFKQAGKLPLVLVLDNIRSQHNIGAAFRTADAFRIEKIYLCGISSPPPSAEIHKAALGAEDAVAWRYEKETMPLITRLREKGYTLIAVEQVEHGVLLHNFQPQKDKKYALIFGNEVKGVQQQVVDACDISLEIPQQGTKHSLNVSVSIGVVLWDIVSKLR
ncbi:MAG: RNA methyltransferase [Prevotellaceae bacterium]|jgi:tRNA G18 (ribose-2'-O)-methylase SpoU|nr:RNA methyltransferase [Prevotellaceae bacterium]